MTSQSYSIIRDDQGRSGSIRYSEKPKSVSLYYEVEEAGFVAYAANPLYWTSPTRELMNTNQRTQIIERIQQWADSKDFPIQIIR